MSVFACAEKIEKLNILKVFLDEVDAKLRRLVENLNWNYRDLLEEVLPGMVTCSFNSQHRIPKSEVTFHEEKCRCHLEGSRNYDLPLSDHSGQGSFITLSPERLYEITKTIPSVFTGDKSLRKVPSTSASLDQNFSREEKLAIYDYVIKNTHQQNVFCDLFSNLPEKKEERRELAAWEIAAAERDAKRRRASYRNKVHTNRKTYTEVLREVIEAQMELLKDEKSAEKVKIPETGKYIKHHHKKSKQDSEFLEKKSKNFHGKSFYSHDSLPRRSKNDSHSLRKRDHHSNRDIDVTRQKNYKDFDEHKRRSSPDFRTNHSDFRSWLDDKYKLSKAFEKRSHFRKSDK